MKGGNRELVIARGSHGYVVLYRFLPDIDTFFVLAFRTSERPAKEEELRGCFASGTSTNGPDPRGAVRSTYAFGEAFTGGVVELSSRTFLRSHCYDPRPLGPQLIQVRESQTHGMGVFATTLIPRRTLIGVYEGRRYHVGEETPSTDDGVTYLFALSDGATIDGAEAGNETRFINHSCRPNCEAIEAEGGSDELEIQIRARRRIRPGEELSLDYALVVADGAVEDYLCRCGEPCCRGTMAGLSETV